MADVHTRFLDEGLLDGSLDAESQRRWPGWARQHLHSCPRCQSQLEAERSLRSAGATLRSLAARIHAAGPPSEGSMRRRLAQRTPAPADSLVSGQRPMPHRPMRSTASPLELVRTTTGLRAWHAHASDLLLLAAGPDHRPVLLRHLCQPQPGASLDMSYAPERGAVTVAVAALEPLDPELWLVWMRDALDAGELNDIVQQHRSNGVHLALVEVPPPIQASRVRLRAEPLPDSEPGVQELLYAASRAGRELDDSAEAARQYRRALERAFSLGDVTGQIKAAAGLSYAYQGLGYQEDADNVVRWLLDSHALDRKWGAWVCRHMAHVQLCLMDIDGAEHWSSEAEAIAGQGSSWQLVLRLGVALVRGRFATAHRLAQDLLGSELPPFTLQSTHLRLAMAQAGLGDLGSARKILEGLALGDDAPLELRLTERETGLALDQALHRDHDWDHNLRCLLPSLREKDASVLAPWDAPGLLRLADKARRAGAHDAARALFRLRFLDVERALDPNVHLLALAANYDGLLLHSPGSVTRLRSLAMTREQFAQLVQQAREELRTESTLTACRALGNLLFQEGRVPRDEVLVASDGLLSDAPIYAIARALLGRSGRLPVLRELVGLRRPLNGDGDPRSPSIVSIADAVDDLHWANHEVSEAEAERRFRGVLATRDRLRLQSPAGLLHLGLHARREQGMPELLFADGPMGPAEIAAVPLEGQPVVLLAGCGTAAAAAGGGVERSLADAFLRAGASAVVATRWPVDDREIYHFVRALVRAWPFTDAASTVAAACQRLELQGHPARTWAAPVVY